VTRHDQRDEDRRNDGKAGQAARPGLSGVEASRRAVRRVEALTGIEPEGVVSLKPNDRGWKVGVEVVEMERIPNSTDVMAVYQVELDQSGELVGYERGDRHIRGRVDGR
jgi:gas vesicle protein GvpO